jgi:hypothetical protein
VAEASITGTKQREPAPALAGLHRTTELGHGPVWRGTSVPTRVGRPALGKLLDKLLNRKVRHVATDEAGRAIWNLCDGTRTIDQIVAALCEQFHGDVGAIKADVMHAIRILADAGLLTSSDNSADTAARAIDLRAMSILVINSEDRPDRRAFMQRQMDALGLPFSFVNGVRMTGPGKGCAQAHLSVLKRTDVRTPFLVLEDDCEFTDNFHYRYVFPEEAEAVYLGVSGFGIQPPGSIGTGEGIWKGVRFTRFGPNYLRVFNMLSGHARLYLTESYRAAVIDRAMVYCEQGRRMDGVQASLHLSHVVLTPNELMCQQNPALGGQYRGTCRSLLELMG